MTPLFCSIASAGDRVARASLERVAILDHQRVDAVVAARKLMVVARRFTLELDTLAAITDDDIAANESAVVLYLDGAVRVAMRQIDGELIQVLGERTVGVARPFARGREHVRIGARRD